MTVGYCGISNYYPSSFSIEAPTSIDGGLMKPKKITLPDSETENFEGNKILDFKTGQYVDYNEYLLKDVDMKYFA